MRTVGVMLLLSALVTPLLAGAPQAEPQSLTGNAAIDAWVRTTFGQAVDPATLEAGMSWRIWSGSSSTTARPRRPRENWAAALAS